MNTKIHQAGMLSLRTESIFFKWMVKTAFQYLLLMMFVGFLNVRCFSSEETVGTVIDDLKFSGSLSKTQANFIIQGIIKGLTTTEKEPPLIFSAKSVSQIAISQSNATQVIKTDLRILQGTLREAVFKFYGDGEIVNLSGDWIDYWSIRQTADGQRFLVITPKKVEKKAEEKTADENSKSAPVRTNYTFTITTSNSFPKLPLLFTPLSFVPSGSILYDGEIEIKRGDGIELSFTNVSGISLIKRSVEPQRGEEDTFSFRFSQEEYKLSALISEKELDLKKVDFRNFSLSGNLQGEYANFTLQGEAIVKDAKGGRIPVLSGNAALTELPQSVELRYESNQYWLVFSKDGTYPVTLKFCSKVSISDGWKSIVFKPVSSVLRPISLEGLASDIQILVSGSKPEWREGKFITFAQSEGDLLIRWKEKPAEEAGKLFFSVDGVVQLAVGAGLIREMYLFDYKILQGELTKIEFDILGEGEITRVRGDDILTWNIQNTSQKGQRKLIVQLNQPKKDRCVVIIQSQTPLGVFPVSITPLRVTPLNAVRYGGNLQVVNDGAVKLEVTETRGLSQVSPELFPKVKEINELGVSNYSQVFAYRFSGADYSLIIQADNILPELTVSELLMYRIGETETAIDAELEIDIREAPLREFQIQIPAGYSVAQVSAQNLADYFVSAATDSKYNMLRLVFSMPISGRQVVVFRLEKNQPVQAGVWELPLIKPMNTKTLRGNIAVSADTGFRLTSGKIVGLTEIAPAYFPKKISGIQLAWRLREEAWSVDVNVERIPLSLQADATHIFTVTEGIIYGSSVINFFITGTPVSGFKFIVPPEYSNIEFTGRDIRSWKKIDTNVYEVNLHLPVYGAYTILATFDRQFDSNSNAVSCVGIAPLGVQNERGTIIIVSEYQFEVNPIKTTAGVLQLDPAEISPDQRLLFTAPILDAYQYSSRPFDLTMRFTSFNLGQSVRQVIDRALLKTKISSEGELVTEARYFVKTHGHTHISFNCPKEITLWEARVNDQKVIPVAENDLTFIPLPAKGAPMMFVDLKWASKSQDKENISIKTPAFSVPILLSEWQITPDKNYKLEFKKGNVEPKLIKKFTGFDALREVFKRFDRTAVFLIFTLFMIFLASVFNTAAVSYGSAIKTKGLKLFSILLSLISVFLIFRYIKPATVFTTQESLDLTFLAPVLEPGNALRLELANIEIGKFAINIGFVIPVLIGIVLWILMFYYKVSGWLRTLLVAGGWTFLFYGVLNITGGFSYALILFSAFIFIHIIIPAVIGLFKKGNGQTPAPAGSGGSEKEKTDIKQGETDAGISPITPLITIGFTLLMLGNNSVAATAESIVQSMSQRAQVQENYVVVESVMKWKAEKGARVDFMSTAATLTSINYPSNAISHFIFTDAKGSMNRLLANQSGEYEIKFKYQMPFSTDAGGSKFTLPTAGALVNVLEIETDKPEQEVSSDGAVSIIQEKAKRGTNEIVRAKLILLPKEGIVVGWRPRQRDTRAEKPIYYAEIAHLFIPLPGVLEVVNNVTIRLAQGELEEIKMHIPENITITDVQAPFVSSWKFDPDARLLQVQFKQAQSRQFDLKVFSQTITPSLPYTVSNGVIVVDKAAGQVGMIGVATGNEVQLESVKENNLSPVNLEDFPQSLVNEMVKNVAGLTLRRAFRYSEPKAAITISVSAVQPDIRAESQETISLGEDRSLLASQLKFTVTRAGIFKVSFILPQEYEVESISGQQMSHWTETKSDSGRIITIHFKGKTEGSHTLNISLVGPGIGNRKEFRAPRLVLREAEKHTGQLVIVPELGSRLHVTKRDGLSQLDPQKVGIKDRGVIAFRILQPTWELIADIESVEPWIQANSLLDVWVREGAIINTVNVEYQIENAGTKLFKLKLPAAAENVRFEGDLISDFVKVSTQDNWAEWDIKLQRRVVGNYFLKIYYQMPLTNQQKIVVRGVRALNANLQKGYVAIRAGGRLEIKIPSVPSGLKYAEWQSIPTSLRRGKDFAESKDTFSALENDFELPIEFSRHEIAKVVPAKVEELRLTTVIATSGEMLTEGKLVIHPGDKRLLRIKLPPSGRFWYAFVNDQSALPWIDKDQILIILEKHPDPAKPSVVEFFYSIPQSGIEKASDLRNLAGPSFDLPLQNVNWTVYYPENWELKSAEGSLQLVSKTPTYMPLQIDANSYMQAEMARFKQLTKEAENLILTANTLVQQGAPQQAKRAFQAAYKMSQQDAALNEDARVQLHNLKMQQAILGLNQRRQAAFEPADKQRPASQLFTQWTPGQEPDYTQQQVKQVLETTPTEENVALSKLAEKLIRQQEAAVEKPMAIRPTLPAFGNKIEFAVPLKVNPYSELSIKLRSAYKSMKDLGESNTPIILALFAFLLILSSLSVGRRRE
ncbi:MAG: hypothetical protein ACP5T0_04180 [Verrucomicrobiia bacterium]